MHNNLREAKIELLTITPLLTCGLLTLYEIAIRHYIWRTFGGT